MGHQHVGCDTLHIEGHDVGIVALVLGHHVVDIENRWLSERFLRLS